MNIIIIILGALLFLIGITFSSYITKTSKFDLFNIPRAFYDPAERLMWRIVSYIISIVGLVLIYFYHSNLAVFVFIGWIIFKIANLFIFRSQKQNHSSGFISNLNFTEDFNEENSLIDLSENNSLEQNVDNISSHNEKSKDQSSELVVVDTILSNIEKISSDKVFESSVRSVCKLKDVFNSPLALQKKTLVESQWPLLPGHREFYYELDGTERTTLINIAIFNGRLVNYCMQILFVKRKTEEVNEFIEQAIIFFNRTKKDINFTVNNSKEFKASFKNFIITIYKNTNLISEVNIEIIDKDFC